MQGSQKFIEILSAVRIRESIFDFVSSTSNLFLPSVEAHSFGEPEQERFYPARR